VITIPKSKGKTTAKDLYAGSNPTSIRRSMFASFGSHVTGVRTAGSMAGLVGSPADSAHVRDRRAPAIR
jgi:hypothetical protein